MKKLTILRGGILALAAFIAIWAEPVAQEAISYKDFPQDLDNPPFPRVYKAAAAAYPMEAEAAGVEGVVQLTVVTDGPRPIEVQVEDDSGHPELARAARDNVMTWHFTRLSWPTTFPVTYRYILADRLDDSGGEAVNSKTVMRFPTEVEVYAVRPKPAAHPAPADRPESPRP